jgi:Tol biopolymer transport system component
MRDGDQDIYVCAADGKNVRRITDKPGYDGGPFFSPDGKRLVYRSDRLNDGSGNLQIFVNSVEGGEEKALTNEPDVLHWCPFWHPSGKWLIYTRADHGGGVRPNYDLYLLSDDGKESHRVTTHPQFDGLPVFSPDGRRIMWTSKRGDLDGSQVFIADFVGVSPSGEVTAKPD